MRSLLKRLNEEKWLGNLTHTCVAEWHGPHCQMGIYHAADTEFSGETLSLLVVPENGKRWWKTESLRALNVALEDMQTLADAAGAERIHADDLDTDYLEKLRLLIYKAAESNPQMRAEHIQIAAAHRGVHLHSWQAGYLHSIARRSAFGYATHELNSHASLRELLDLGYIEIVGQSGNLVSLTEKAAELIVAAHLLHLEEVFRNDRKQSTEAPHA